MTNTRKLAARWLSCGTFVVFLGWLSSPTYMHAQQSQGNNAVYDSQGSTVVASAAYIDATAFSAVGDICRTINNILLLHLGSNSDGVVIDARGFLNSSDPNNQGCTTDPFAGTLVPTRPVTILLPASNIQMSAPWTIPNKTRIIGEGPNTNLQAFSITTSPMINMGSSLLCPSGGCTGVGIEHLKLDGMNKGLGGIVNAYSGEGSYVVDVQLYRIQANTTAAGPPYVTGLTISAPNSGPYNDVNFTPTQNPTCSSNSNNKCKSLPNGCTCPATACVQIQAQTRGLHGITCEADSYPNDAQIPPPPAAIFLDASNNSIKDVHGEGSKDVIVVGANPSSSSNEIVSLNVIANVSGVYGDTGPVTNVVHICKGQTNPPTACSALASVTDLSVFQARSTGGSGNPATTVLDDVTGTTINSSANSAFVGMYVLGEPLMNGQSVIGYSRFTTSPFANVQGGGIPNWSVGNFPPSTSCSSYGALFSNTSGGLNQTLWLCTSTGGWKAFK
jgi:hypothetical protein